MDDQDTQGFPAEPPTEEMRPTPPVWQAEAAPPEPPAPPVPPAEPPAAPAPDPTRRRPWPWVAVAGAAALVGALAGGGIVAAVDDDGATRPARSSDRNTSVIADPQDIQGVLAKVQPAVVSIRTEAFQERDLFGLAPSSGAGTGMVISPDGEVLTNQHVVAGATSIRVTLYGETEARDADLVGGDPSADVALLRIRDARGLPTVTLGDSSRLRVGDDVGAIGNALALPGGPTVTRGIVSALDRSIDSGAEQLNGLIQTDAAINPGNSGGPLVNSQGEVVGINTAVIQNAGSAFAQNIGLAIAVNRAKPIIEQIRSGRPVVTSRAFLGVSAQTLTPEIRRQFDFGVDEGAVVFEVTPGSPAENAGIRPGDVITRFADKPIETADELVEQVRAGKPGDRVEIVWVRRGEERRETVTLGARQTTAR